MHGETMLNTITALMNLQSKQIIDTDDNTSLAAIRSDVGLQVLQRECRGRASKFFLRVWGKPSHR